MEPRIQYCTTSDGVHLAFSSQGEGTPVVYVPSPSAWGTMQVQLQVPSTRAETGELMPKHTVVRYDCRGAGLSDRDVADLSFDAHVRDCLALRERVSAGPVALVFCHGFLGWHRKPRLVRFQEVLAERFTIYGFDFRGHGESEGLSAFGAMEHLDVELARSELE